jgi:hypothetical protein
MLLQEISRKTMKLEPLDEKMGSRVFTKLISDTSAAIVAEAGTELRDQEVSRRALETRVLALLSSFEEALERQVKDSIKRIKRIT